MTSREQVNRLLALVPYLQSHDEVRLDEAAAAFAVTPEQIVRDLNVLWFCGLPGLGPGDMIDVDMDAFEPGGDGVIRLDNADFLRRPLRLGSTEASALMVALRAMREGSPDGSRGAIDRALAKLEAATADGTPGPGHVLDVPRHAVATAPTAAALADAVARGRQVRLSYFVPSRDETTERVVDPIAVLEADGHAYLDAWCHLAEARRLFRLDRVTALDVLDVGAQRHDVAPRDLSDGLFEPGPDDVVATVLLDRPARWVAEYYPVESTRERGAGQLEVQLRVGDPQWLVRLVLRLAPYARLVAPTDLIEQVRASAAAALAGYDRSS